MITIHYRTAQGAADVRKLSDVHYTVRLPHQDHVWDIVLSVTGATLGSCTWCILNPNGIGVYDDGFLVVQDAIDYLVVRNG